MPLIDHPPPAFKQLPQGPATFSLGLLSLAVTTGQVQEEKTEAMWASKNMNLGFWLKI